MKKLAIFGSGDLGKLIAHHAETCGFKVVGFFDDYKSKGELIQNNTILGGQDDVISMYQQNVFDVLILGIGYYHLAFKELLFNKYADLGVPFANVIHPSSYVDESVHCGRGIFICPGCTLDAGVILKDGVVLNTGVTIAHDTTINSFSFLAPAVKLAGFIQIGSRNFLGIGTTVINSISTCNDIQTGAGTVITRNITEKGLYLGIPARKIK